MPDLSILEWVAVLYGVAIVALGVLIASDRREWRSDCEPLVSPAEWARIEAYANDPRHAARGAYIEARARRDARTQQLVQGTQRNPPRAVGAAEAGESTTRIPHARRRAS